MKDVTIRIKGMHLHDGNEEEQMELITEAKLYERNGVLYLLYDESDFTGMQGSTTRLRMEKDSLKLSRSGDGDGAGAMLFEKGKRYENTYRTPMGLVDIEILTNDYVNTMTAEGTGMVDLDYTMSLKGLTEGRSRLHIEFIGRNEDCEEQKNG